MKGKIKKNKDNVWLVEYEDIIFGDNRLSTEIFELQLHPTDVIEILELNKTFDNFDARINCSPDVEFKIIEYGEIKYAKLKN
jgi:hypothetical protein